MRELVILWRIVPLILSIRRDFARWIVFGGRSGRSYRFHERRARKILKTVVSLGPTFVKMGQVFSARPDVIREPYLGVLGQLTDKLPNVGFEKIEKELEVAYGEGALQMFDWFDKTAIASGSLGQVYKARYLGEDVAVKVLRPGVEELVAKDIFVTRRILGWLLKFWDNRHLRGMEAVLNEFEKRTGEEMDFRLEAVNGKIIKDRFKDNPRVIIPGVIENLTRKRVLVMEYVEGERVDSPLIQKGDENAGKIIESVIEIYIQMMLVDGLFHADPHPGNLLIGKDGKIVLLDFGMVVPVGSSERRVLAKTALAAVRMDAEGVTDGFFGLGIVEVGTDKRVIYELVKLLLDMAHKGVKPHDVVKSLTDDVMETLYDWPILLTGEMVYFGRAVALVEGIGARLMPDFNAVQLATPVILRHHVLILKAIGESSGGRLEAFDELVYEVGRIMERSIKDIKMQFVRQAPSIFGAEILGEFFKIRNFFQGLTLDEPNRDEKNV